MRLLMVAAGPPSPVGRGYQVRLHQQIIRLADRHEITLLVFAGPDELDPLLRAACHRIEVIPWSARTAVPTALLHCGRLPLSVGLYRSNEMETAVASEVTSDNHGLVHVQLVRMAPYLAFTAGLPTVLDLLDAAELNMRERARASPPPIRPFLNLEAARLGAYEKHAMRMADTSLLISRRDLDYVGNTPVARILPNGIDPPHLDAATERESTRVVFSGRMSYFPNSDAATWFSTEIFPMIQAVEPDATLRIVGREPTAAIKRLASRRGVTVTGTVPRVDEELSRAAVSVCPMRFGSGMPTKILEAMATGTPVVATTKALEGLPEDLCRFIVRADSKTDFANEVVRIIRNPVQATVRAAAGLSAIQSSHSWKQSVDDLEGIYVETSARVRMSSAHRRGPRGGWKT